MGELAEKLNVVVVTIKWKLVPGSQVTQRCFVNFVNQHFPISIPHIPTGCLACLMASSVFR